MQCEVKECERDGKLRSAKNVGDQPDHELHAHVCDQHWERLQGDEQAMLLRELTKARNRRSSS
jgi:hypothetical protein